MADINLQIIESDEIDVRLVEGIPINVTIDETSFIDLQIIESDEINIQLVEDVPISVTIGETSSFVKSIFDPPEGGKRVIRIYVKNNKLKVEYEDGE